TRTGSVGRNESSTNRPERWWVSRRARAFVLSTRRLVAAVHSTVVPFTTCTRTLLVWFVGSLRVSTLTLSADSTRDAAPTCLPVAVTARSALPPGTLVLPRRATTPCSQAVRGGMAQRRASGLKTAV